MSGRILAVIASAVAAAALAGAASGASSAKPPKESEPVVYVTEAVEQPFDIAGRPLGPPRSVSEADHRPTVADRVAEGPPAAVSRRLQSHGGSGCRQVQVTRIARSLLGFELFRYWQTKYWCWNSGHTVSSVRVGSSGSTSDPTWFYRGTISSQGYSYNWCCSNGSSGHYSFRQGKFEQSLGGRIVSSKYPWVKIWAYGNGGYSYETGGT
jgi:hypothetical protein